MSQTSYKDIFKHNDFSPLSLVSKEKEINAFLEENFNRRGRLLPEDRLEVVRVKYSYAITRYYVKGHYKVISQIADNVNASSRNRVTALLNAYLRLDNSMSVTLSRCPDVGMCIDIPNNIHSDFYYGNAIDLLDSLPVEEFQCYLGESVTGDPVTISFGGHKNVLIAGCAGSGKSVCLRNLLLSLFYRRPSSSFDVYMIDNIKRSELTPYAILPNVKVLDNVGGTIPFLSDLQAKLDKTMSIITKEKSKHHCADIYDYNNYHPDAPLKVTFLVIEEADALLSGATLSKHATEKARLILANMVKLYRAAGLHVIITSQSPSAKNLGLDLRNELDARIGLMMTSNISARFVMENDSDCTKLRGRGDALFRNPITSAAVRLQTAALSTIEFTEALEWLAQHQS